MSAHLPSTPVSDRATHILHAEHRVIRALLAVIAGIRRRCVLEQRIPTTHAQQVLEVLDTFVDRCHHAKEEHLLFPALEAEVQRFAPTQVLRQEHHSGRGLVTALTEALGAGSALAFAAHAGDYLALMQSHIDKEDRILFPLADTMLSDAGNAELLGRFQRHEHDDLGAGTHERMLGIIDGLADAYGVPQPSADARTQAALRSACACHHQTH